MKKRFVTVDESREWGRGELLRAMLAMQTSAELEALLTDLCTPAEIEAMIDRFRVLPHLLRNEPYREIHDQTAVSVTTIGRVARTLQFGTGGYRLALQRLDPTESQEKVSP